MSSHLQHRFSLSSVYSHYAPDTGVPEVTTCHSRSAITVDYIFYSAEKDGAAGGRGKEHGTPRLPDGQGLAVLSMRVGL